MATVGALPTAASAEKSEDDFDMARFEALAEIAIYTAVVEKRGFFALFGKVLPFKNRHKNTYTEKNMWTTKIICSATPSVYAADREPVPAPSRRH